MNVKWNVYEIVITTLLRPKVYHYEKLFICLCECVRGSSKSVCTMYMYKYMCIIIHIVVFYALCVWWSLNAMKHLRTKPSYFKLTLILSWQAFSIKGMMMFLFRISILFLLFVCVHKSASINHRLPVRLSTTEKFLLQHLTFD